MKFLILNGPNLNLLGLREPELYGRDTYDDLLREIDAACASAGVTADVFQSNHEGDLIDRIQEARGRYDGILINAGGYTHTSVAILDALLAVGLPTVEVHLTDPDAREPFRRVSLLRAACFAVVKGKGIAGYGEAIRLLAERAAG